MVFPAGMGSPLFVRSTGRSIWTVSMLCDISRRHGEHSILALNSTWPHNLILKMPSWKGKILCMRKQRWKSRWRFSLLVGGHREMWEKDADPGTNGDQMRNTSARITSLCVVLEPTLRKVASFVWHLTTIPAECPKGAIGLKFRKVSYDLCHFTDVSYNISFVSRCHKPDHISPPTFG